MLNRDGERDREHASQLLRRGRTAKAYRADAGEPEQLAAALNQAIDEVGAPDVLVYNAAMMQADKPTELDAVEWSHRLAVNVIGAVVATRTVLPRLGDGRGTLLFTGFGLHPSPDYTAMSIGKAALRAYVLALFEDQRANRVHAATVTISGYVGQPGFEADSIAQRYLELHHQAEEQWAAEIVVG